MGSFFSSLSSSDKHYSETWKVTPEGMTLDVSMSPVVSLIQQFLPENLKHFETLFSKLMKEQRICVQNIFTLSGKLQSSLPEFIDRMKEEQIKSDSGDIIVFAYDRILEKLKDGDSVTLQFLVAPKEVMVVFFKLNEKRIEILHARVFLQGP